MGADWGVEFREKLLWESVFWEVDPFDEKTFATLEELGSPKDDGGEVTGSAGDVFGWLGEEAEGVYMYGADCKGGGVCEVFGSLGEDIGGEGAGVGWLFGPEAA